MAPAISSSPQLAGTTFAKPARIHACASCTGVAGNAASTASVPRITTGTVCGTGGWVGVLEDTARVRKRYRCDGDASTGMERDVQNVSRQKGLGRHISVK